MFHRVRVIVFNLGLKSRKSIWADAAADGQEELWICFPMKILNLDKQFKYAETVWPFVGNIRE